MTFDKFSDTIFPVTKKRILFLIRLYKQTLSPRCGSFFCLKFVYERVSGKNGKSIFLNGKKENSACQSHFFCLY